MKNCGNTIRDVDSTVTAEDTGRGVLTVRSQVRMKVPKMCRVRRVGRLVKLNNPSPWRTVNWMRRHMPLMLVCLNIEFRTWRIETVRNGVGQLRKPEGLNRDILHMEKIMDSNISDVVDIMGDRGMETSRRMERSMDMILLSRIYRRSSLVANVASSVIGSGNAR